MNHTLDVNVNKQQRHQGVVVIPANSDSDAATQNQILSSQENICTQPRLTLNVAELAYVLGIGMNNAYELVHSQGFPAIKIGRRIVIPIKALESWLYKAT